MRSVRRGLNFGTNGPRRIWGMVAAGSGSLIIIKVLPLWIWPFGIVLWLLWAALGPIVVGGILIWVGWRLLAGRY
jgi:hypothetical protein